ncbi:UNVERIFIED_ORG: hypothetical protein J2W85_000781 [Ensifer adhaerens]|nr:hypothetical protein [Ensifer adhaerens]
MKIGKTDTFEDAYMAKFRSLASNYGVFVEYARDAAARDIGLHFTQADNHGARTVTPALAWFQMKGIMASTVSAEKATAAKEVSLPLQTDHLKFWFLQPVPTYLVVYVESLDRFLVINIQRWVESHFGDAILESQNKTHTVKVALSEALDDQAFYLIMRDNMIETLKKRLAADDAGAKKFYRDAEVIKWLHSCGNSEVETRFVFTSWISKMRSEARFEYKINDQWEIFRNHWQYSLDDIEDAFPYIEFVGMDEDEYEEWRYEDEEHDAEIIRLANGTISAGPNCSFEFYLHEIGMKLNAIGKRWAKTLIALEQAGAISVSSVTGGFISVAPWHARQL